MSYLTQAQIADDQTMRVRVASCAAQQGITDAGLDPDTWAREWCRVWAAAPGWDAAWEASGSEQPGADAVEDAQILSQVQSMMPFTSVGYFEEEPA